MSTPAPRRILVIGLPQTGKTTFLAALWDVVNSSEIPSSLQLDHLEGDQHHMNEIRSLWADCNEIPRTRLAGNCTVAMTLRDPVTTQVSEIHFPDMDGESFERQWTERTCSEGYQALVRDATGALLFVHPEKVSEAPLITDAQRVMRPLLPAGILPTDSSSAGSPATDLPTLPAEPHYAPTQVVLVELLQFIRGIRSTASPFRLTVVLSAWDVIRGERPTLPDSWLKERLPLLNQFLLANADVLPFAVFGVSAQGGELKNAPDLRRTLRSSDRIIVAHGRGVSHDITEPLRWLLQPDPGEDL